jgi:hypothetical protein
MYIIYIYISFVLVDICVFLLYRYICMYIHMMKCAVGRRWSLSSSKLSPTFRRVRPPQTPNPKPQTPNSNPQTPNPKSQTSNPRTQTPNPKPQTPNPKPQIPNPKPQPQTLNPKPQTPNPKPQPGARGQHLIGLATNLQAIACLHARSRVRVPDRVRVVRSALR